MNKQSEQSTAAMLRRRPTLQAAGIVGLVTFFGLLAIGVGRGWFTTFDALVLDGGYMLRQHTPWFEPVMAAFTNSGFFVGYTIQTLLIGLVLIVVRPPHWRSSLIFLALVMISGTVINGWLKDAFARPRPSLYPNDYALTSFSFPSGHAMSAAILYGSMAVIWARSLPNQRHHWAVAGLCAVLTLLMGVSRIYFSVHYATDVLAGFCVGLAWLATLLLPYSLLTTRRHS